MNVKNLIIIFCMTLILLISCSESKEKDSESNIDEATEMITRVESENISINEIPDNLTITSESKEKDSESNISEPIEMIIVVEPENININEIPEILTITIENISNAEWHGDYHCAIDFFNGDDWELVYAPVYIDLPFLIEANSTYTNYVPTDPDTINYTVGRYRVRFGVNIDGWGGWYGEFSIS